MFYVKTKEPLTYCFYQLRRLGLQDMNTDGAVPGLNRNNVYRLPILLPVHDLLLAFDEITSPLRQKIFANLEQAQTLTTLRDTLLPRLISGQLRVPEAVGRVSLQGVTRQIEANMSGYAALTRPTQGHEKANA